MSLEISILSIHDVWWQTIVVFIFFTAFGLVAKFFTKRIRVSSGEQVFVLLRFASRRFYLTSDVLYQFYDSSYDQTYCWDG